MSNSTHYQVDLTSQACQRLSVAMTEYRDARWAYAKFQAGGSKDREEQTLLFNHTLKTMGEARRLHDEYLSLESTLNQMGGMKRCT